MVINPREASQDGVIEYYITLDSARRLVLGMGGWIEGLSTTRWYLLDWDRVERRCLCAQCCLRCLRGLRCLQHCSLFRWSLLYI
jgi:hypothetical protein